MARVAKAPDMLSSLPPQSVRPNDVIAVWFSCGVPSAVAAKTTLELYGNTCRVRVLNNPVIEEDEDNLRFKAEVQRWLGVPIEDVRNPDWPTGSAADVWAKRRYMSDENGAPCTEELKKGARQHWEITNKPHWHVLGYTAEEAKRFIRFRTGERENALFILGDAGLTRARCNSIIAAAGIAPPRIYGEGYPNANCIGCVKATSPTYWNLVRTTRPEVFQQRCEQSRDIGAKLVRYKGERIFLDELPAGAKGRRLKKYELDCGIYCEERP